MPSPPKVLWLYHATASVLDYDQALDWLGRVCGCRALEFSESQEPLVARKGGVTWIGDSGLELAQPLVPGTGAWIFQERFGPGLHSIAFQVDDLTRFTTLFDDLEIRYTADFVNGFAFTHPADTDGILFEWADSRFEDWDPHFGADIPPARADSAVGSAGMPFVGAIVVDPAATAKKLGEIFPGCELFRQPSASPYVPEVGISVGDKTLLLYRMSAEADGETLWGMRSSRPRTHLLGFAVHDLEGTAEVRASLGVRTLHRQSHWLISHPQDTLGIVFLWADANQVGTLRDGAWFAAAPAAGPD